MAANNQKLILHRSFLSNIQVTHINSVTNNVSLQSHLRKYRVNINTKDISSAFHTYSRDHKGGIGQRSHMCAYRPSLQDWRDDLCKEITVTIYIYIYINIYIYIYICMYVGVV